MKIRWLRLWILLGMEEARAEQLEEDEIDDLESERDWDDDDNAEESF